MLYFATKIKVVSFFRVRIFSSVFREVLNYSCQLAVFGSDHQILRKIRFFCVPGIYTEIHKLSLSAFPDDLQSLFFVICSILYLTVSFLWYLCPSIGCISAGALCSHFSTVLCFYFAIFRNENFLSVPKYTLILMRKSLIRGLGSFTVS